MPISKQFYSTLFILFTFISFSQEAQNQYFKSVLDKEKVRIMEQERSILKEKIKAVNTQYTNDEISLKEADSLKMVFAEESVKIIETRILEREAELFENKDTAPIEDSELIRKKEVITKFRPRKKKHYLSSDIVVVFGLNHLIDPNEYKITFDYDFIRSFYVELGWSWKTNIIPSSDFLNIRYGFSFQLNSITTKDNRYFVSNNNAVSLRPIKPLENNDRAKLNYSNFVFPVHLEFGSRRTEQWRYTENGSTVHYNYNPNSIIIGAGVYGGFKIKEVQKIKNDYGGNFDLKEDLNVNNVVFGFSGYISLPKFITFYGKIDMTPIFTEQTTQLHNIAVGMRFGI